MLKLVFGSLIFLSIFGKPVFAQGRLKENLREVKKQLQELFIYQNLEKKRFYAGVKKGAAVDFELRPLLEYPTSIGIGIAGDGGIQEMQINIYDSDPSKEEARLVQQEVTNKNQFILEVTEPLVTCYVEIKVLKSKEDQSTVELIYSFFYGSVNLSTSNEENSKNKKPNLKIPKQDPEVLIPNDQQNRFEAGKKTY